MTTSGIHDPPIASTSFSRFHAIVAAKPLHGFRPPVIDQQHIPYEPWKMQFHTGKRKRDTAGVDVVNKAVRRDHGSNLTRGPTKLYQNREELLRSMKGCFSQAADVNFHGMYELSDSGITHKQRIQTVTHEIWKTTGYRFTVKDHPQVINGHKTRFWCSQDEAHRSKSSKASRQTQGSHCPPRVTNSGEIITKARYPCRSRLLISSRDSDKDGIRMITVRMHHHFAHEPYVDCNLPPEVAQGIWESFGWIDQSASRPSPTLTNEGQEVGSSHHAIMIRQEGEEGSTSSDQDKDSPTPSLLDNMDEDLSQTNPYPTPTDSNSSGPSTDIYHDRMNAHIKNLREFCDGLEYQLQFNDYRMLNILEREGGSFLSLVEDCLQKEGRLVIAERPHSDTQQDMNGQQDIVDRVPIPSGSHHLPDNPGINPEVLSR